MSLGNVDYWRTFRNFESNAIIIADQSQDVLTFRGGENIIISFDEGDDIITWHADLTGIISDVTANISVINEDPIELSMLEYDPASSTFTYFPSDLSDYATLSYVDTAVASGVANIDLSEYATERWVQGYVGTAVNIPDTSEFVTKSEYNEDLSNINYNISQIEAGPTGFTGSAGSGVTIVGSVENYNVLITVPRWTNYLGQLGDGVITQDNGNLVVATTLGPPTNWDDTIGPIQGPQGAQGPRGFTGSQGIQGVIGFTGSASTVIGFTGSQGDQGIIGFTGSQGIIGFTGSQGDQGEKGFDGSTGFGGSTGFNGSFGYTGSRGFTGSKGDQGDTGYTGSSIIVGHYVHTQSVASDFWTVNHNLGVRYLSADVINDSSNSLVGTYSYPTITYVDENTATVAWSYATTGKLILVAGSGAQGDQGFNGSTGFTGSTGTSAVTTVYTFANLPSSVSAGARAFVSDSPFAPAGNFGQPAQSGGTNLVPVFYNGLIWIVG